MKNATGYQKKVRKVLAGMGKARSSPPAKIEPGRFLIEAILQEDTSPKEARRGVENLNAEFVDYNELRVAPHKDIIECLGADFPLARQKAETLVKALNAIFDRASELSLVYMEKMTKRDLRQYLLEIGMSPFAAALVTLGIFGGHALPVDRSLADCLEMNECVHPDSSIEDIQGFLERVIPQKDGWAAYMFFREWVEGSSKAMEAWRKKHRKAEAKQEPAPVKAAPPADKPPVPVPPEVPAAPPAKGKPAPAKLAGKGKSAGPGGKKN